MVYSAICGQFIATNIQQGNRINKKPMDIYVLTTSWTGSRLYIQVDVITIVIVYPKYHLSKR